MFGFARRRAVKAAKEHGSAIIRLVEAMGGLPDGFWEDPYIVGWITGFIYCVARAATNNRIGTTDLGRVLMATITAVAGAKGKEVVARSKGWARTKDEPKFNEGVQAATKTYFVSVGAREFDADPEVVQARQLAKSRDSFQESLGLGASTEQDEVSAAMQHLLFYDVVERMRSSHGSDRRPD